MGFNLDFLYAAIVICMLVVGHFLISKRNFKGLLPRWVLSIVLVSLLVTLVDICDSLFIDNAANVNIVALYVAGILLYALQLMMPFLLYVFSLTITGSLIKGQTNHIVYLPAAIYAVAAALIITTPITGLVFSFDPANGNAYSHGPLQPLIYGCGVVFGLCVLGIMIANRKYLRRIDQLIVCFGVLIILAVSIIQTFLPHLCLVGFGASCGAMMLYISFNDSSGLGDTKTGGFEPKELRRRLALLVHRGNYFDVTFVTIDNLRHLNNTIGPEAVDSVLRMVSYQMMDTYKTEQIYKFQGARFCVITYDDEETKAMRSQMQRWLHEEHEVDSSPIIIDARVTAMYDVGKIASEVDLETFLSFLIEEVGGNFSDDAIDQDKLKANYMDFIDANAALDKAISEDSFEIFLQPLYSTATGTFESVEVLSRLKDENGRYIPPATFIKIAEENGSIHTLSRLQFFRLCRFLSDNRQRLQRLGVTDVKYNVSAAEISSPERVKLTLKVIRDFGLDPSLFSFEVTETAAYSSESMLLDAMHEVQAAGCRVYMDDFGSGYANIETVFRLPFGGVKLDISLLHIMHTDENAANVYHGLVDMMHVMGKKVVSEGIEEKADAQLLAEWGVDVIQGYYYSRPLPERAYIDFLEQHT